jgi:calcium/calmodulin-dependent protein kinase kinase 2
MDPLLSKDENVQELIEPPTEAELKAAITGNMGHLLTVVSTAMFHRSMTDALKMRAVKKFKELLFKRRPDLMEGIFGHSRIVQPPLSIKTDARNKAKSVTTEEKPNIETALTSEGVHRDITVSENLKVQPESMHQSALAGALTDNESPLPAPVPVHHASAPAVVGASPVHSPSPKPRIVHIPTPKSPPPGHHGHTPDDPDHPMSGKGQAHDPLEDTLFLNIGTGAEEKESYDPESEVYTVSESPSNADINVYEQAYQDEVDRILAAQGRSATLYLTRRVEHNKALRGLEQIVDHGRLGAESAIKAPKAGLAGIAKLFDKTGSKEEHQQKAEGGFASLVEKAQIQSSAG